MTSDTLGRVRRASTRLFAFRTSLSRRSVLLMLPLIVLAACNVNQPNNPTPTVEILISPTATPTHTPSPEATITPEATLTQPVVTQGPIVIVTVPPNDVPNAPTLVVTVAPPETPTPWVYVIQAGDNLGLILGKQPWGYNGFDPAIQQAVVRLNNMFSADILPPTGSELLIPQRTWTPIPEGNDMTQIAGASAGCSTVAGNLCLPGNPIVDCYTVKDKDTILGIREQFNTTLETLSALNPNLNWGGCVFTEASGGPNCAPFITVNQCVRVPFPTPTPVPTSTPSGSETPTATPTRVAAVLVYPPSGVLAPAGTFELQWVSAGILASDQVYLVEVQDVTAATEPWRQTTRDTSMELPGSLIPSDGQAHQFQWRVTVVNQNEAGVAMNDGQGSWRPFQWQSR